MSWRWVGSPDVGSAPSSVYSKRPDRRTPGRVARKSALGGGKWLRKFTIRVAVLAGAAFVLDSLLVIAGGNVKAEEVRARYSGLHPRLRIAVSVFVLG